MNKVVTINLNGRAYQIEEHGYALLNKYLGQAEAQLADNPDREEIIADFEQAIAEKCDELLGQSKTVVSDSEIESIIEQMGPVDGKETESESDQPTQKPVKRLYLIKDGAIIGGVCTGIATYFNIDVTIVRLIVIVATFLSSGALILAYLVLLFIVPEAKTPEQKAAAQGTNFDSKTLIETAKKKYASVNNEQHWKRVAEDSKPMLNGIGAFIRTSMRVIAGVCAAGGIMLLAILAVAAISSVWTIVVDHSIYGVFVFAPNVPIALITVLTVSLFALAIIPIYLVTILFYWYAKGRTARNTLWALLPALVLFVISLGVSIALLTTTPQIKSASYRNIQDGSGFNMVCLGDCSRYDRFLTNADGPITTSKW